MRLTTFTDYCLRVLIYVGVERERRVTIDEIAERYRISRNHLMRVVFRLGQLGYLETVRGKGGGFRLKVEPSDINLGRLVLQTEEDLQIVECFRMMLCNARAQAGTPASTAMERLAASDAAARALTRGVIARLRCQASIGGPRRG